MYDNLSDFEKKKLLIKEYEREENSFAVIANKHNTYANKLRRDAIRFHIKIRDKSEAQKKALQNGRVAHPTKGKKRSEETKEKIGMGILNVWENMSEKEYKKRQKKAKENWEKRTDDEKEQMLRQANQAVRVASKEGSKLEKYLLDSLIADGFKTEFHKEQSLVTTKLQIDLFLPKLNVAIEVDGPSHREEVWGKDALARNIKYDTKKTGLILGKGLTLVRITQNKDFSPSRAKLVYDRLKKELDGLKNKTSGRIITIED